MLSSACALPCAPAGVRKHCRKTHPEWLREVDLDKANNGCRWAAYCTRETITEGNDPRTTPVGAKRAREIIAQAGGQLPPMAGGIPGVYTSSSASYGADSSSTRSYGAEEERAKPEPPKVPRCAPHLLAMDGKSAIVPLRQFSNASDRSSTSENLMPPVRARTTPRR